MVDLAVSMADSSASNNGPNFFRDRERERDFASITCSIADPDTILSWSFGEVKSPETINYRTYKPERSGLFCAKIFGPTKDFECLCEKYKSAKYQGIICDKCGVEVTRSRVRRERMGHIKLATPMSHIWFLKSAPSRMAMTLDMRQKDLERVIYFESYVVTDPGTVIELSKRQVLGEREYGEMLDKYGDEFKADIGAAAIRVLLRELNLTEEIANIQEELAKISSSRSASSPLEKLRRRLSLLRQIKQGKIKPEWMILTVLPVLPPDLRPLVPIDGGRFTSSDLNDLYRRVINRNNRLARLIEQRAPSIIVRNENRMVQEAVDALLDNGRRGSALTGLNRRKLKSLSDMVRGKQGRFRQNLLGKRVDYSGRSVITVGPQLKLHQCGLPKNMALELFKPFVIGRLERDGHAQTLRAARAMLEQQDAIVWDILNEVIYQHPVLLNRAPTLHRLGIQAFEPVLIEGSAIQLHPLVCTAFNADFDGDQMSVHVPLTYEAQAEARVLMMSSNNILSAANGQPVIMPSKDMLIGVYYLTRDKLLAKGEYSKDDKHVQTYADGEQVEMAFRLGYVDLQANIRVRLETVDEHGEAITKVFDTTPGRIILRSITPKAVPFDVINRPIRREEVSELLSLVVRTAGTKEAVIFADQLMYVGFRYATASGLSFSLEDLVVPKEKEGYIKEAQAQVDTLRNNQKRGLLSHDEMHNRSLDVWGHAHELVGKAMSEGLSVDTVELPDGTKTTQESFNPLFMYAYSGARGSTTQLRQLAGMRGLMARPDGSIIPTPITANFREGLNVMQYFMSTPGARKGLTDTALKTANSGYLTRRLVDVTQEQVVSSEDCGTENSIVLRGVIEGSRMVQSLGERANGRYLFEDVIGEDGQVLLPKDTLVSTKEIALLDSNAINEVKVRSVIHCENDYGVCSKCYGSDLSRSVAVAVGEAVGVIAAQSIGEPGTQLTMRTIHMAGAAARKSEIGEIIVSSGGRVEYDERTVIKRTDGSFVQISYASRISIADESGRITESYKAPIGAVLSVANGETVEAGAKLAQWDPHYRPVIAQLDGSIELDEDMCAGGRLVREQIDDATGVATFIVEQKSEWGEETPAINLRTVDDEVLKLFLEPNTRFTLNNGDKVKAGDFLAQQPSKGMSKTSDITGGLKRIIDLFEARSPQVDKEVLTSIAGKVTAIRDIRGKKEITLQSSEDPEIMLKESVPADSFLQVAINEDVEKGEVLVSGTPCPKQLLICRGIDALADYIINEVQAVYRAQGVDINDKHIEMILRQMLRLVEITEAGETELSEGDRVTKEMFRSINRSARADGRKEVKAVPVVVGITKASLETDSFISAASFQETTKILTGAAIVGKKDHLRALKENVILGRLIPSGSGFQIKSDADNQGNQLADAEAVREELSQALQEQDAEE